MEKKYSIVDENGKLIESLTNLTLFEAERQLTKQINYGVDCYIQDGALPINSEDELISLAKEFADTLKPDDATAKSSEALIEAAQRLAQRSDETHSLVVPTQSEYICAGDGSGCWVPAYVFVPNAQR